MTLFQNVPAVTLVFALSAGGAAAQEFDPTKRFTFEMQDFPVTQPSNPASTIKDVDCGLLQIDPATGRLVLTGRFIDQFDPPPKRASYNQNSSLADGHIALQHIGSMLPESHQICTAQANILSRRDPSVDPANDRYCAPIAAAKLCTTDTADDQTLSDVYRVDPVTGNVTLQLD